MARSPWQFVVVVHEEDGMIAEDEHVGPFRTLARAEAYAERVNDKLGETLMARVEVLSSPSSTETWNRLAWWHGRGPAHPASTDTRGEA